MPTETTSYTTEQIRAARAAVTFWDALPCNPLGVSKELAAAVQSEYDATGSMDFVGKPSPVHVIQWALKFILTGSQVPDDIVFLVECVEDAKRRIATEG